MEYNGIRKLFKICDFGGTQDAAYEAGSGFVHTLEALVCQYESMQKKSLCSESIRYEHDFTRLQLRSRKLMIDALLVAAAEHLYKETMGKASQAQQQKSATSSKACATDGKSQKLATDGKDKNTQDQDNDKETTEKAAKMMTTKRHSVDADTAEHGKVDKTTNNETGKSEAAPIKKKRLCEKTTTSPSVHTDTAEHGEVDKTKKKRLCEKTTTSLFDACRPEAGGDAVQDVTSQFFVSSLTILLPVCVYTCNVLRVLETQAQTLKQMHLRISNWLQVTQPWRGTCLVSWPS